MSQSAAPPTQNGMTTCFDTFEKERFCSFPRRHGEATGKPETRDQTRGSIKTSISCETSSNFHNLQLENRCFLWVLLYMNLWICYLKIDVSCEASVKFHHISRKATPATEFAPCRPLPQPWQCDSQKTRNTTRLKYCACHAKWRWTRPKCCANYENCNSSCEKVAPHKTTTRFTKHVWLSRSATLATRNEATPHVKPPKVTPFCRTYQRHGHMALTRTVANGCGRLRTVADGCMGTVERTHPQLPDPQSETGTLAIRIRDLGKITT